MSANPCFEAALAYLKLGWSAIPLCTHDHDRPARPVAVAKTLRRKKLQFVAVTCHEDVEDWLNPDWVYRPAENAFAWRLLRQRPTIELTIVRCSTSPAGDKHVRDVRRQLTRLADDCKWILLKQISTAALSHWLHERSAEDMAPLTQNHYIGRLREFIKWCVEQHWLAVNPIMQIRKSKVGRKGRRRLRRAYTQEEWNRLIGTAPEPRRTIYLVASLSGHRKKELRTLTPSDFTPIGDKPHWHLRADKEKSGRGDRIPMLLECAEILRPLWINADKKKPIFDAMPKDYTLHRDLKAANIPRQDERGRWADFHSLRYFFCTMLQTPDYRFIT